MEKLEKLMSKLDDVKTLASDINKAIKASGCEIDVSQCSASWGFQITRKADDTLVAWEQFKTLEALEAAMETLFIGARLGRGESEID